MENNNTEQVGMNKYVTVYETVYGYIELGSSPTMEEALKFADSFETRFNDDGDVVFYGELVNVVTRDEMDERNEEAYLEYWDTMKAFSG